MLSLCAPVTVELQLGSAQSFMGVEKWRTVIEKLAAFVNEFKVSGLELRSLEEAEALLSVLEGGEKYYHLLVSSVPQAGLEFLAMLRRCKYFGSLLVDYLPEDAEVDAVELERLEQLREFAEQALAVGFEVNARVALKRWACAHLEEVVESASDFGFNQIICYRCLHCQDDEGPEVALLEGAVRKVKMLADLSYGVSMGNCVPNCFCDTDSRGCLGGIVSAVINEKGDMLPCGGANDVAGSLLEAGVTEVWRSPSMNAWRENLPSACLECSKVDLCPGGCRALREEGGCDPLIRQPFKEEVKSLHEVVLEEDLCPTPRYAVRREDFGWALIRANQVIPVSAKAEPILQRFDGHTTLADIERQVGAAALSFIYSLYVRGFVEFVEASPAQEKGQ